MGALGWSPSVHALQPLDEFVRGARAHDPVNHEAVANRAGAEARADQAFGSALPGLSAAATYTRNQWEVSFGGMRCCRATSATPRSTLAVPLLDLAKFARISAAARRPRPRRIARRRSRARVEAQAVQLYYQLAADLALVEVARKALDVVLRQS